MLQINRIGYTNKRHKEGRHPRQGGHRASQTYTHIHTDSHVQFRIAGPPTGLILR